MVNVPLVIVGEMRGEFLSAQVGQYVAIPRMISGDKEEMFIEKIIID